MLFNLTCKSRKYPESIRLTQGLVGCPLSLKLLIFFPFSLTDVTVDANMIIQSEIHVLQADLAVFSPNVVMFIKPELLLKQKSHSKIKLKIQSGVTFLIMRVNHSSDDFQ